MKSSIVDVRSKISSKDRCAGIASDGQHLCRLRRSLERRGFHWKGGEQHCKNGGNEHKKEQLIR